MTAAVAIEITSGAERDLAGIWQRRLTQRGPDGDDGADALLDDLVASIESLVNNPEKGPVPPELEALGITDFRQLLMRAGIFGRFSKSACSAADMHRFR